MIEIDDSERIVRVVRKHWFVLLGDVFILIFCIFIPVVTLFALHFIPFESFVGFLGNETYAGAFFFFGWLLVVWMMGWNMWTDYYLDVLIVTDKRIFDINQEGLFKRESSSFRIDKIQNVTVDQKGIIQTLLDFGTIKLETAGDREDFIASYIAKPYEIKKFINEMQDKEDERSKLVHFDRPIAASSQSSTSSKAPEKLTRTDGDGL